MRGILLAYCVGVMLATFMLRPLVLLWWTGAAMLMLLPGSYLMRKRTGCWQPGWRLVGAAGIGVCWHCLWALAILEARLPAQLEGREMRVIGFVTGLPATTDRATQFQFQIEESSLGFAPRRVLLNFYGDQVPAAGQRWSLQVRLNRPHGFANPGGFDYEAWLFQQGISAKGYVRNHPDNRLLGSGSMSLQTIRQAVRERMTAIAGDLSSFGILLALSLGDRSQLQTADWQLMSASGTNHLFVISGLHIGLIAMAMYWLVNWCLRWLPGMGTHYPRQKAALWCALVAALAYSLLAGFTLPTQRAFIMTAVFILGQLSARPAPVSVRYLLALAAVLTGNPLAALNAGFWLSFAAVAALLLCLNGASVDRQTPGLQSTLRRWLLPQCVVFLALTPFLLFWVQQVSLLSPLLNVVAIPLVGLLVVPLILLGVILLAFSGAAALPLFQLCEFLLGGLFAALGWVTANARWSVLEVQAMPYALLLCIGMAMLLLLAPVSRSLRLLVIPLFLPVLFPTGYTVGAGALDLHILDVGQGLSVVARTANHALVYDTGAALSPEFDLGTAVVVPVLRQLGIESVDTAVISHFDNDHAGGLAGLLAHVRVNRLVSSDPWRARQVLSSVQPALPDVPTSACEAGAHWNWDGVDFQFLHPEGPAAGSNNNSCVLRILVDDQAVLLPGDIESAAERALVLRQAGELESTVLVAPHHGSNTSSSYAFIKQVSPRFVVYTAGYRNSFGHPTARIRQRYQQAGAQAFVTHDTGMLSFHFAPGMTPDQPGQYRPGHPRYWH